MAYDDEAAPETSVGFSGVHGSSRRASSGRTVTRSSPAERTSGERSAVGAANGHVLTRPRPEAAAVSAQVAKAALGGLTAPRKTLPPSLFYDEEGCRLFYEITKLPEYYLTRSEFRLLERTAPEVTALLPTGATLVEYGASDETKAEMLLRQTSPAGQPDGESVFRCYIPIDVAAPALRAMRDRLADRRPGLTVLPVTADFMRPIVLPERRSESALMGFFPGSTIGNLEPGSAVAFLRRARLTLHPAGHSAGWRGSEVEHPVRFLLGFDTCRDPARLVPAYDDSAGVTARFNRNLLVRLNREAGGTFDPDDFIHRAVWNEAESRIEMHLVSRSARTVMLAGQSIDFARGETIHTENSYKYAPERMRAMVEAAGWSRQRAWTDPDGLFTLWLLAGSRCDPPRPEFPVGNIK
jgi:dimethylhistidine N-methyltransferase